MSAHERCSAVSFCLVAALLTMLLGSPASAQSGYGSGVGVGVAVNGNCLAGVCPPTSTPINTNETLPYSFTVTTTGGDMYRFTGNIVASNTNNGNSLPNGEIFMVTYIGPSATTSQADTLVIDQYLAEDSSASSFNNTNPFAVTFSANLPPQSSAKVDAVVQGVTFPTIGPFFAPGTYSHSDVLNVPGGNLRAKSTYTAVFGAGTPIGGTMWMGFTAPNPNGLVSAVLPTARTSSQGGGGSGTIWPPVTAFGTIINSNSSVAKSCSLTPPAGVPGTFHFQTTNASTNLPTGTPDTLVDIPAGGSQTYVFSVQPTATFSTEMPILFSCASTTPAATVNGLNTFLLTASSSPIPDAVSIAATPSGDGILTIPGTTGTAAFGQAAINLSTAGNITFSATDAPFGQSPKGLPVMLTICQSNPSTGVCTNPTTPGTSATVSVANNQTVTFSIFATGQGLTVPFDPANNRIFVIGKLGNTPVAETSVAVRTQ